METAVDISRTSASALQVRVYRDWDELMGLSAAWEHLLQHCDGPTIFSTPEWLGAWWQAFGHGKQLMALAFSSASGELVGLAPFYLEELEARFQHGIRRLRLVGDGSGDSDNLDLIFHTDQARACCQALLTWLGSESGWSLGELNTLPARSAAVSPLVQGLKERGWTYATHARVNSAVPLPESWAAYLRQLPSEHAHGIERYTRRLQRHYAVRIFRCADEEMLPTYLDTLYDLHQRRWNDRGQPGTFVSPERRRFYAAMSRNFLRRGWLELWLLELNGTIAAAQFAFRFGDTVYQLQEGLDPAHYSDRAGQVLRAHVLRQLITEGVRSYDYLGGISDHKRSWGAQVGAYTDIHFAKSFTRAGLVVRLKPSIEEGRLWLRAKAPAPAYSLIRAMYHGVQGH